MSRPIYIRDAMTRDRVMDLLENLDLTKPWEVVIRRKKSKRSIDQNSLYWKWLTIIADDTGNTANDIHEWCKQEFQAPVMVTVNGKSRQVRRSTTDLTTAEMTLYLDRINAWAGSELGILLPHPDDLGR